MYEGLKVQIFVKGEPKGSKVILKPEISIGDYRDSDIWLDDEEVETWQAEIRASSERTVACGYCNADVFLPDELWRKLHPVKTSAVWYLRFDGKSPNEHEAKKAPPEKIKETPKRLAADRKSRFFWRVIFPVLMALPFALVLLPFLLNSTSQSSGDGPSSGESGLTNTSLQSLQAAFGRIGETSFSISVPPGFEGTEKRGGMLWSVPNAPLSYVAVTSALVMPRTAEEAVSKAQSSHRTDMRVLSAKPVSGGFFISLKHLKDLSVEVQLYRSKAAAVRPELVEDPEPMTDVSALYCVAHIEHTKSDGPIRDVAGLLESIASICDSLSF